MAERYVCVHGHFYQPPRENPWLETVERQDSAHPYHDWNERVTAEAYAPNAAARILDGRDRIVRVVNNYARISFNFGPTLLSWLEPHAPQVYAAVMEAEARGRERAAGAGPALAQAYGHVILPLANLRDKRTQIRWGIRDFEARFGRSPRGMWLPETAVDVESLDVMAEEGIEFTVLAPHQARAIRPAGDGAWRPVPEGGPPTTRPYRVPLPSGRSIAVFFYHGPLARSIAFEGALSSGDELARRMLAALEGAEGEAPLLHVATDGETYGHHHTHGEMALAYALHSLDARDDVAVTTYAEYLERHPPAWEARVEENTSWSCSHGVERWRSDCGCNAGRGDGWHQKWRAPLRGALDWLRDELAPLYARAAGDLFPDPWEARDRYVEVILDRSPENVDRFLDGLGVEPGGDAAVRALKLLELQRHAMLMYTSCGWFFDEISDIETLQVLRYAGRAIQLARELFGEDLEGGLLRRLEDAPSNRPDLGDGRRVFEEEVRPTRVRLEDVGAHYAISDLYGERKDEARVYSYDVERDHTHRLEDGSTRLVLGRLRIRSRVTREGARLTFAVLGMQEHRVSAGVRVFRDEEAHRSLETELREAFEAGEIPGIIRILDHAFPTGVYSLRSLLGDTQRRIVEGLLESSIGDVEAIYARILDDLGPLMRFVAEVGVPQPRAFRLASEYVLNSRMQRALDARPPDLAGARHVLAEVREEGVELDPELVGFSTRAALERLTARLEDRPRDPERLADLEDALELVGELPFEPDLWGAQRRFYAVLQEVLPTLRSDAADGDEDAEEILDRYRFAGECLRVAVEEGP